jgi:hypothetical protein
MGIINRIRKNLESLGVGAGASAPTEPEQIAFSAEIPGADHNAPLWRVKVQLVSEPHGDGERLRLRAHVQTNFASALRPALSATPNPQKAIGQHALTLSERTTALAQRALSNPVVNFLAQPLLKHDFNTWIELQASTASLDDGAHALVPQSEKLLALGIRPTRRKDGAPVAESWAGQSPGGTGFAQVSIVQMDKRHLPPRVAAMLGGKPFQMAAAIINTVEEK